MCKKNRSCDCWWLQTEMWYMNSCYSLSRSRAIFISFHSLSAIISHFLQNDETQFSIYSLRSIFLTFPQIFGVCFESFSFSSENVKNGIKISYEFFKLCVFLHCRVHYTIVGGNLMNERKRELNETFYVQASLFCKVLFNSTTFNVHRCKSFFSFL
jgi:hypothetical protein